MAHNPLDEWIRGVATNIFEKVEVHAGGCEIYYPPNVDTTSTSYVNDVKRYGNNVHILKPTGGVDKELSAAERKNANRKHPRVRLA